MRHISAPDIDSLFALLDGLIFKPPNGASAIKFPLSSLEPLEPWVRGFTEDRYFLPVENDADVERLKLLFQPCGLLLETGNGGYRAHSVQRVESGTVRGKVSIVGPMMFRVRSAEITPKRRWYGAESFYTTMNGVYTDAVTGKPVGESPIIATLFSIGFNMVLDWSVIIEGISGIRFRFVSDARNIRKLLALRDIPDSANRRPPVQHWLEARLANVDDSEDDAIAVRAHLRGSPALSIGGYKVRVIAPTIVRDSVENGDTRNLAERRARVDLYDDWKKFQSGQAIRPKTSI